MKSKTATEPAKCSPTQRKFLLARIRSAPSRAREKPPEPTKIRAARRIVNSYDEAMSRVEHGRYHRERLARANAEKVVHFGSASEALAAVEAFEKLP